MSYDTYSDCEDEHDEVVMVRKMSWTPGTPAKVPSLMHNAVKNAKLNATGLRVCDLEIDEKGIDPTKASMKKKLLEKLGVERNLEIDAFNSHGFNNAGLWTISHPRKKASFVMKLVDRKKQLAKSCNGSYQ